MYEKYIQFFPAMLVAVGHQCPTGGNGGWCNCPISSRQWGLGLNKHKLGEKSGNNGNKIRTMLFKSPSFQDLKLNFTQTFLVWISRNIFPFFNNEEPGGKHGLVIITIFIIF